MQTEEAAYQTGNSQKRGGGAERGATECNAEEKSAIVCDSQERYTIERVMVYQQCDANSVYIVYIYMFYTFLQRKCLLTSWWWGGGWEVAVTIMALITGDQF